MTSDINRFFGSVLGEFSPYLEPKLLTRENVVWVAPNHAPIEFVKLLPACLIWTTFYKNIFN